MVEDLDAVEEIHVDLRSIRESLQAESKDVSSSQNNLDSKYSVLSNDTLGQSRNS